MPAAGHNDSAPRGTLAQWQSLLWADHAPLLAAVQQFEAHDAASLERLRATWPAELVHLAIELNTARRKAAVKFGEAAAKHMFCDVIGVEQATSAAVAAHKAKRFAEANPTRIIDLCCGIGGDAMSLAQRAPVLAVDRSAVRAWMAQCNARCDSRAADADRVDVEGAFVHVDPDRRSRSGGRRAWRIADYEPGPAMLQNLIDRASAVAIKLGPGAAFDELPVHPVNEIELISEFGTLVQAVLWTGSLVQHCGKRTATMLPSGATFTGEPGVPIRTDVLRRCVYTLDPTLERAGLIGAFIEAKPIAALHPRVGVLTSDDTIESPWLSRFLVHAMLPWRQRTVSQWLRAHGAGIIEVKTRGCDVETDTVQRALRSDGDEPFTVFVLRMDRKVVAIICQRCG
jgi:hypothetical protein